MYKATLILATLSVRPSFKVKHLFYIEKQCQLEPIERETEREREREGA